MSQLHNLVNIKSFDKGCHCKKSNCLKLYCDCFQSGSFCSSNFCVCQACHNKQSGEFEFQRQGAIMAILERNPNAFRSKIIALDEENLQKKLVHEKGCNCKKSGCLKKYCECYQGKSYCTPLCRCKDCFNQEGNDSHTFELPPPVAATLQASAAQTSSSSKTKKDKEKTKYAVPLTLDSIDDCDSDEDDDRIIFEKPYSFQRLSVPKPSLINDFPLTNASFINSDVLSPSTDSIMKILSGLSNIKDNSTPEPPNNDRSSIIENNQTSKHLDLNETYNIIYPSIEPKKSYQTLNDMSNIKLENLDVIDGTDSLVDKIKELLVSIEDDGVIRKIYNIALAAVKNPSVQKNKQIAINEERPKFDNVPTPPKRQRLGSPATTNSSDSRTDESKSLCYSSDHQSQFSDSPEDEENDYTGNVGVACTKLKTLKSKALDMQSLSTN